MLQESINLRTSVRMVCVFDKPGNDSDAGLCFRELQSKHLNITINYLLITINKMVTAESKTVLLTLFKDFSNIHTITSLSKITNLTRVGIWKILKKLESKEILKLTPIGAGKTSTSIINLNWDNPVLDKSLVLYLTEEMLENKRWKTNFSGLEPFVDFLILYGGILHSYKSAKDIDIIGIVSKKANFIKIQKLIEKIQKSQIKKIHLINFTHKEFKDELIKRNTSFIDAVKNGVV